MVVAGKVAVPSSVEMAVVIEAAERRAIAMAQVATPIAMVVMEVAIMAVVMELTVAMIRHIAHPFTVTCHKLCAKGNSTVLEELMCQSLWLRTSQRVVLIYLA